MQHSWPQQDLTGGSFMSEFSEGISDSKAIQTTNAPMATMQAYSVSKYWIMWEKKIVQANLPSNYDSQVCLLLTFVETS